MGSIWKIYQKRSDYSVHFRKALPEERVYNYLEDCESITTEELCIVMTGLVGENWVIREEKFLRMYHTDHLRLPLCAGDEGIVYPNPSSTLYCARKADGKEKIVTLDGDVLKANRDGVEHGDGDMIVCFAGKDGFPRTEDSWVVNGAVFARTYSEVSR